MNMLISILIQLIYLAVNMTSNSKSMIAIYAPLAIIVLVIGSLAYNIYYFILDFKEGIEKIKDFRVEYN